jgi:hypothetical protein
MAMTKMSGSLAPHSDLLELATATVLRTDARARCTRSRTEPTIQEVTEGT